MIAGHRPLPRDADVTAPDGSDVRILCALPRGSMAHFTLGAGRVSRAIRHRTVDELWFVLGGVGLMWRRSVAGEDRVIELVAGLSLSIPVGTAFQFRADQAGPLTAVAVTMPPWPGEAEAEYVDGCWPAA